MSGQLPPLWKHQERMIDLGLELGSLGIFADPGTGKTRTTLEIWRRLCNEKKRILKTLILCPKIVMSNWQDEFYLYTNVPKRRVRFLDSKGKKRVTELQKAIEIEGSVVILNYDAFAGGKYSEEILNIILKWSPEFFVCDESHQIKSPEAKRSKAAVRISYRARHRFLLTGTAITNAPTDIWNQFRVLDHGDSFGHRGADFYAFRSIYMHDKNEGMPKSKHFPNWVARPEMLPRLNEKIYKKAFRVKKSECLDLPDRVRTSIKVKLTAKQRSMYEQMKRDFIAFLDERGEDATTAQIALTKSLRLNQIVNGFIKTDEGKEIGLKENPKVDALKELLDEIVIGANEKVIIWSIFRENYNQIEELLKKMKIGYRELTGRVTGKDRDQAIKEFRSNPDIKVMIASQQAAGIGINLIEASYAIYLSRGYRLDHDIQSEDRNYRGGSEMHDKITRIDIVAEDTIDELVLAALRNKKNISEEILKWREKI